MYPRNVFLLSLSQTLGLSGAPVIVFVGGIVGSALAPSPSWATLPIATMVVGTALFTIPASLVMKKIGRRPGFAASSLVSAVAALAAAYAIGVESFALFCGATLFIGGNLAFVQQYRFAAAESVDAHRVGNAVSFVLLGGVVAGYLGPEIARITRDWLDYGQYTATFSTLAILYIVVAVLLLFLREGAVQDGVTTGGERSLRRVVTQPTFVVAMMAGIVGYGVMSFVMTATPISMHVIDGHSLSATARVIQSHVIAMYLPALFSGYTVGRWGVTKVMATGVITIVACVLLGFTSHQLLSYWAALVVLGVGWNFMFVAGTVLLTESYRPGERFKAQAANDFMIFATQAVASLSAGTVLYLASWEIVNLLTLPFLLAMFFATVALHRHLTGVAQPVSSPASG